MLDEKYGRSSTMVAVRTIAVAVLVFLMVGVVPSAPPARVQQAIDRGVKYLKSTQEASGLWTYSGTQNQLGATALAGLALLECGVPATDPAVQKTATALRTELPGL